MEKRKILYIGQMVDITDMASYSGVSTAGALYEYHCVTGLESDDLEITAISVPPVAAWPRDQKLFYRKTRKEIGKNIPTVFASFLNLPFLKQLVQMHSVYRIGREYMKKNPNAVIMSYNTYPQIGVPVQRLVNTFKVRHVCILADLPYDDRANPNFLRRLIWQIYGGTAWKLIKKCKEYIILNEHALTVMPKDISYEIIEGGIDPSVYVHACKTVTDEKGRKILLYAGALTQYSGIMQLIEAMDAFAGRDLVLHIYGDGDKTVRDWIQNIARTKENVVYKGRVSVEEVRRLQANAWLLVNPRPIKDPISKVTFPSKILEYMASGTPVMSTDLGALTKDYKERILVAESEAPKDLEKCIEAAYRLDEDSFRSIGAEARRFVLEQKSWGVQCRKVRQFLGK